MSRIFEYVADISYDEFCNDQKTKDAVIRNFEIIGEASKNLPREIKVEYDHIPWREMCDMRNKVSHEYFGVNDTKELLSDLVKG